MVLRDLISGRRTVHAFNNESVDNAWIEEALRLSLWAPNHRLTFPWRYYWLGPRTRAALADLAIELRMAKEPLSDVKAAAVRESICGCSHLLSVGVECRDADPARRHEDYASLASGLQNAALFLWEKCVGCKWSTGGWSKHPRTYEILGADAAEVALEGALLIGWPKQVPAAAERPALERFLQRLP